AEVRAPRPRGNGDVRRAGHGVQAHLAVAQVHERPYVAPIVDTVLPHQRSGGLDQLVRSERDVDKEDLGRREQAVDVVAKPEHGHASWRRVCTDTLEYARAIVHGVREDMDGSVSPGDELAVHPDLVSGFDRKGSEPFCDG